MADLTLEPFDDKQLRIVRITLPEGEGIIPVFCIFYRSGKSEFVKIAPAVGLYPEQASRLEYHFAIHNEWKKRDQFLIQRRHLGNLTDTVSGITPSYYYRWPGKSVPVLAGEKLHVNGEEIQPIPDDAESFLEYVHKKRGIDRNVLRLAWSAISKEAAAWLLKKRKPINLGFVNLYAVPYRANWKEILLAKFPNGNAPWWFRQYYKNDVFTDKNAEAQLRVEMVSAEMIAIHGRDHNVMWTMEAVPSESWEADVKELELMRKSAGNTSYVRHYEKTASDMFQISVKVFMSWLKKITVPFAKVQPGNLDGSVKMVPYRGSQKMLPKIGVNIPVRVVLQDGPAKVGQRALSESFTVRPKIDSVPSLPSVPQAADDVRECDVSGGVDGCEDGNGEPSGMPMLSSGKAINTECELLAVRSVPGPEPVADRD